LGCTHRRQAIRFEDFFGMIVEFIERVFHGTAQCAREPSRFETMPLQPSLHTLSLRHSRDWLKMKNPSSPAVKREAEED
jgi:hypothetical protein